MLASQVIRAAGRRFHPSRLGAIPLFLGTLLLLRWSMGGEVAAARPWHLVLGGAYLAVFYVLTPMPWQWTGDGRHRPGLLRAWAQAALWNAFWLMCLAYFHQGHQGPEPPVLAQGLHELASRARLSLELMRAIVQLPFAVLIGWFIAEKEAAELDRAAAEAARAELETRARESRVQALLAQLDPHVLYNALGAMAELVREDPARAETALLDLSDLYRRLTRMRDRAWITLAEERSLLEQYLAIERLRLGSRLRVHWDWPGELEELRVPPLLVLPLAENAIKHGLAPEAAGGELGLLARREGAGLRVEVSNTGRPLGTPDPAGTGLRNLRARLALLGGGASTLELERREGRTVARLCLEAAALGEAP